MLAALLAWAAGAPFASADTARISAPLHALRGVSSVRVSVGGLSTALGTSSVTESALRASVFVRLKKGGVPVAADDAPDAPELGVSVLPVEHASVYFVTVQVELREPCTIPRDPRTTGAVCVTWSTGPQTGIVDKGAESQIETLLVSAVDRFVKAWQADNPKSGPAEKPGSTT